MKADQKVFHLLNSTVFCHLTWLVLLSLHMWEENSVWIWNSVWLHLWLTPVINTVLTTSSDYNKSFSLVKNSVENTDLLLTLPRSVFWVKMHHSAAELKWTAAPTITTQWYIVTLEDPVMSHSSIYSFIHIQLIVEADKLHTFEPGAPGLGSSENTGSQSQ